MISPGLKLSTRWAVAVGPLVFLAFVLLAGAVGGGLGSFSLGLTGNSTTTRSGTRTSEIPFEIKVTHVVFNHNMDNPREGTLAGLESDALSMRIDFKTALLHGPVDVTTPLDETGAGEWIVNPDNPEIIAKRNEPILYLRNQLQRNITIFARFEASSNVRSAEIDFVPEVLEGGPWASGGLQPMDFKDKSGTPQDKFKRLSKVSSGLETPRCFPSTSEYEKFHLVGAVPDFVNRTRVQFQWRVHKVNGVPLVPPQPLNHSGIRTPALLNDLGHNIYHVLNTPTKPWYESLKTMPWKIALDEVVLPTAARGASQIPDANASMTRYVFSQKGWVYDTVRGAPGFVEFGGDPSSGGRPKINLTNYITGLGTNSQGPKVVDCYDLAGSLESYINLIGADSEFRFCQPFGYMNLNNLIGVGFCNNPFFNQKTPPGPVIVDPKSNVETRIFGNHAYVIDDGKVFDANIGPSVGTDAEVIYRAAAIAQDTPIQRSHANLSNPSNPSRVQIAR